MATYTLYFNPDAANGTPNNWYTGTTKNNTTSSAIPPGERITQIVINATAQGSKNETFTFKLVSNASNANSITIGTHKKTNASTSSQQFTLTKNFTTTEGNTYAGKNVFLNLTTNASGASIWGRVTMTVTTGPKLTAVVAGNKIYKTDLTQTGATADDATYIKYRSVFSSGTKCEASTFNSQVLGL